LLRHAELFIGQAEFESFFRSKLREPIAGQSKVDDVGVVDRG
jgi:hypothetical protein